MFIRLVTFILFTLFLYGCGDDNKSQSHLTTCVGDVNETYIRITHPLVTQSDLEAVQ